ncbi:hypothetical protein GE107_03965 [Cohnella sp. CFH 77786]|uniref:DUF5696 domain-containing protein n=1 Tax=Cohnella sp. CFH 77786 TaxID=2662265 RepID=UPI001C60824C|nr:DUF5696 domain-containing protein [Cohnella sp. CFH 77786]MBW5445218.1 hypothetical protein [Cohnella sp. CFH 77786]
MRKITCALLAACLLPALVAGCSGASSPQRSEENREAVSAVAQGKPLRASFTDSRVDGMKGIVENDRLQLFADDQTGAIAVRNKQSGEIWHSNPPERDSDSLAAGVNKELLSSQLKLDFYNSFGQIGSVNSYADSFAHKQIQAEAIQGGLRVVYTFGTAAKTAEDLPLMLSFERFESLSGKVDKAGRRALMTAYRKDEAKSVYVRNDDAVKSASQLKRTLKAFEDAGYTEEDLKKDMEELNFTQEKPEGRIFKVTVEYVLDADSLVVRVPASGIRYPANFPVNRISVLSFFGAGGANEEGTIFVPDGSGALIHFNNGKIRYPAYQQSVYGSDLTMERTETAGREQTVRLPVFGMIKDSDAFLGIIEDGAPVATLNADVSGRLNSYNYVYPSFNVVNKGQVTLNAKGKERTLPKFQESPVKTDFTIRYAFLSGKDASWQGMARYYQQYLEQHKGLPERKTGGHSEDTPFYLQLVGSISKRKHFVGIPYQAFEPLTTFQQAQSIVEQMQERGVGPIRVKYSGWFNGGLDHQVPDNVAVDRAVGGSKGLRKFAAYAQEKGVAFYPDVAMVMAHSGKGFNENEEAAVTLSGIPAKIYPLDLATQGRDRSRSPSYVVSPRLVGKYADGMLEDLKGYKTGGISLRDLADQLNSDYRIGGLIDRAESEEISVQALNRIRGENLKMMADGGNAYALPYLTDITNAPLASSGFKLEDEEVPFYPMVVRGYIDYTGEPYNLSAYTDYKQYMLKCLEYGAGVYFEWIYEPNYKIQDTEHSELFAVHYGQWIDQAAEIYREVNETLKNFRNERIVAHEKLEEGVYKTVYESGGYVVVNYNLSPVTVEGRTLAGESYMTGGERS